MWRIEQRIDTRLPPPRGAPGYDETRQVRPNTMVLSTPSSEADIETKHSPLCSSANPT